MGEGREWGALRSREGLKSLMEEQRGDGGVQRAGREGQRRLVAGQGLGGGRARQGSGAPRGVTGSSVTCPPLTKAICCREKERRQEAGIRRLEKRGKSRGEKKGADVELRGKFVFRILVLISILYCAQACPFF